MEAGAMQDIRHAQDLIGHDVYDRHGDRIGRVDNVYIDDATDQPEWVTVRSGVFITKENFVPLAGASQGDGGISVCVSRTKVKSSPQVKIEDGHLSNSDGHSLYRHYGIQRGSGQSQRRDPDHRVDGSPPAELEQTMPGGITLQPPDPGDT
jgi:sporulation protein YlmC with PRC-barrel domain